MTDKQPLDYASPPTPLVEVDSELARRVLKGEPPFTGVTDRPA